MHTLELVSVDGNTGMVARDLLTGTLAGNGTFAKGWFSVVSALTLLLMKAPLSVDIDLLTGGDGDLRFPGMTNLSSTSNGIFGAISLSANAEGNLDRLCLPEEQLLA
ncbi:hypothetical protein ACFX2B_005675 [Malus domestica]